MEPTLRTQQKLKELQQFTVPTLHNAVETFNIVPSNTGFCGPEMRCMLPDLGIMVGYAVTARIASDLPPSEARPPLYEPEMWRWIVSRPGPRIAVVQDMDVPPKGAIWGEYNANVYKALGCVGTITEGGVRDLIGVRNLGFHFFATCVLPSHAYAVFTDYGGAVRVGGMIVETGDLLAADRHGVIRIPAELPLDELIDVAIEIESLEQEVFDFCQSPGFDLDDLEKLNESVLNRWPRPRGDEAREVQTI